MVALHSFAPVLLLCFCIWEPCPGQCTHRYFDCADRAAACFAEAKSVTLVKWNFSIHIPEVFSPLSHMWQFRGCNKEEDQFWTGWVLIQTTFMKHLDISVALALTYMSQCLVGMKCLSLAENSPLKSCLKSYWFQGVFEHVLVSVSKVLYQPACPFSGLPASSISQLKCAKGRDWMDQYWTALS